MQKILLLVSVLLVGAVEVYSLQCYVCDNCPTPTEADLLSCDEPVTTTTPAQTTTTTTTTTPTTTSTQTTVTTAQTTVSPAQTTVAPAQTTVPPAQTTTAPVQTTITPENTDPTVRRFKRNILSIVNSTKTACDCKNEVGCMCDSSLNRISTYADYVCFKVVMKKDNVIVRGCAPATLDNMAPCELEDVVAAVSSCSTCDTDQCNAGYMTQFSVYLLLTAFSVVLFR